LIPSSRLAWAVHALPCALLVLSGWQADAAPRAAGGVRLLDAMDEAPATVVALVREPGSVGPQAFRAELVVETSLRGRLEPGMHVSIAWEELAASRGLRFDDGERVLVSLVALPGASIWRQRFPDDEERTALLTVAMDGDAFLRRPALGTVVLLQHYLALGGEARQGEPGAGSLVNLAVRAELPLGRAALDRLRGVPALNELLGAASATRLVAAFQRPDADAAFLAGLAGLIGSRSLEVTRPALESLLASKPPAPAEAFEALVLLDGGISGPTLEQVLEEAPPARRRVAARHANGPEAEAALARLLRADPVPEVRLAAAERLAELGGEDAIEPLLLGLGDTEPSVRGAAARWLGGLGEPAVAPLRQIVGGNDPEAASAAVVALGLSPAPEAREALVEISASHPDGAIRSLAEIALSRSLGHRH
jgi:HEAT repeat protein